jgi:hypothetical protein
MGFLALRSGTTFFSPEVVERAVWEGKMPRHNPSFQPLPERNVAALLIAEAASKSSGLAK